MDNFGGTFQIQKKIELVNLQNKHQPIVRIFEEASRIFERKKLISITQSITQSITINHNQSQSQSITINHNQSRHFAQWFSCKIQAKISPRSSSLALIQKFKKKKKPSRPIIFSSRFRWVRGSVIIKV
eukprot:Lithocolla_globosa_v1_NODE_1193_length_2797_cov_144.522247.p2 type:complete len:128 gc:universal NODE_1193_length_2797_cov_144.522247:610-993(+)